jgi:hypothetical protein
MTDARALSVRLAELLSREHTALAEFLLALADFDRRRAWVELGYSSLFYFLHRELGLSKGAAYYRKGAAELVEEVPAVIEPLRDGRLCLSSVSEAAKVVTAENWETVLPRFFHRSKREAMEVVAALAPDPSPPSRTIVTSVVRAAALDPAPSESPPRSATRDGGDVRAEPLRLLPTGGFPGEPPPCQPACQPAAAAAAARPEVVPLTADLHRIHMTVSRRLLDKLEAARTALSHSRPGASEEEILEAGLDLLLARAAKRRGLVEKPRDAKGAPEGERIPAHVRRTVWKRDGGRCQWPLESGGICASAERLELDHVIPRARGGPSTAANLRLLCRFHNDRAARLAYGDRRMDRYTSGPRAARTGAEARPGAPP